METEIRNPHDGFTSFIDEAQSKIGMSDQELSEALGFSRTSVLTLIKTGKMKMPVGKVPLIAAALEVPASDVLAELLKAYYSGELLEVMRKVWGQLDLSPNEKKLLASYRAVTERDNSEPRVIEGKNIVAVLMI
jgi:hypothetical protein